MSTPRSSVLIHCLGSAINNVHSRKLFCTRHSVTEPDSSGRKCQITFTPCPNTKSCSGFWNLACWVRSLQDDKLQVMENSYVAPASKSILNIVAAFTVFGIRPTTCITDRRLIDLPKRIFPFGSHFKIFSNIVTIHFFNAFSPINSKLYFICNEF
jgi:hypothetical protein